MGYVKEDLAVMSTGKDPDIGEAARYAEKFTTKDGWGGVAEFSLLYSPGYIYNDYGAWITAEMKNYSPSQASQQLASYLHKTQKYRESIGKTGPLKWCVLGESSKILNMAIGQVKGNLNHHAFEFKGTTTDISSLVSTLRHKGAEISESSEFIGNSRSSRVAMAAVGQNISNALDNFSANHKNASQQLASQAAELNRVLSPAMHAAESGQVPNILAAISRINKGAKW